MTPIEHLQTLTLDLPPSCIEFWPLNSQYAVIGTYNLERAAADENSNDNAATPEEVDGHKLQERNGSIVLVKVDGDNVTIIQTLSTPFAVLDIHFAPQGQPQSLFGVASSAGSISMYQLTNGEGAGINSEEDVPKHVQVVHVNTYQIAEPHVLATSFLWHPKSQGLDDSSITACLSLSNGDITIAHINHIDAASTSTSENIGLHELEAWTVALMPDGKELLSGGDDSALSLWDLTKDLGSIQIKTSNPSAGIEWTDRRIHGAGVTAILPLRKVNGETLVLTGSYDDHIRLISVPMAGRRRVFAEMNLGGGVWRLKQLETLTDASFGPGGSIESILLLASCMHAGARILRLSWSGDDDWHFEVLARFEEHKSMNYGSDSQPSLNARGQRTFITTSFYDRLLCLWRF